MSLSIAQVARQLRIGYDRAEALIRSVDGPGTKGIPRYCSYSTLEVVKQMVDRKRRQKVDIPRDLTYCSNGRCSRRNDCYRWARTPVTHVYQYPFSGGENCTMFLEAGPEAGYKTRWERKYDE